jgi:hypothetical protein
MPFKPKDHSLPKACKTCKEVKPPEAFYIINKPAVRQHLGPGRQPHCIICHNKRVSERKRVAGEAWHKKENFRKMKWINENRERHDKTSLSSRLKRLFNITLEDYDNMLKSQNGTCAICKQTETKMNKFLGIPKRLAVDHCHMTGKVRGLLCFHCNSSIGKLKDSVELLQNAIEYLKKSKE